MSVESNSWLKTLCMTTTGVSTLKWSLLAMTVIRSSGTKRNWHTTLGQHIKKRTAFIVMSNLVRFNAFIILQRKATWGLTRKECMRNPSKTLLNLCVVCVTTELTPSLTWTDTVRSAKLWIQVPSITLATCATRHFLQRSGSPPVWISNSNVCQKKQTSPSTDLCVRGY